MTTDKIEIDYEAIQKIIAHIQRIIDVDAENRKKLIHYIEELEAEGWSGAGAQKFYREMYGDILPALMRLETALDKIKNGLSWVMYILRDGEESASNLFKGGVASLVANMKHQTMGLPSFPPPPAKPSSGDGSGAHGSNPTGLGEIANSAIFGAVADGAEVMGLDDAARHMRHYLNNSGQTLNISPEEMMRDMPAFRQKVEYTLQHNLINQINERIARDYKGEPLTFQAMTPWQSFYAKKEINQNWFYAMGGFSYAHGAEVTVTPDATGQPIVNVRHQLHVFDRYNWDEKKSVTIGPVTVTDKTLQALHESGIAREYDIRGSSNIIQFTYRYENSQSVDTQIPTLDDRTGTRGDLNRNR